jgi:hypothetical protein
MTPEDEDEDEDGLGAIRAAVVVVLFEMALIALYLLRKGG